MRKITSGDIELEQGGADSFMFPHSQWTNDHMHMYFNSLEETVTRDSEWTDFEDMLKTGVEPFLGNRGLRQRFMVLLPIALRAMFANYSRTHIDWKWEFLELELAKLEPLLEVLLKWF